jgi:hypothetical protein
MPSRTVTLELLRHGPSYNQLLSPLTPYLALSGNYDAETVHVSFDHVRFVRQLRDLRYQGGQGRVAEAIDEASREVTRMVASIRSLGAEISAAPRGDAALVHVRLVLSASELSLLPFELVRSPPGFPAEGQWLSLQTTAPIALTREARRVPAATIRWPDEPRILVAAASPPSVPRVPLRAHLLAIRGALDPWLPAGGEDEVSRHVTVLPRATLAEIRDACARAAGDRRPYTHVHILAHGMELPDRVDDGALGYGLALHDDGRPDEMDVVTGARLAAALRAHAAGPLGSDLTGPAVVTVASCDSGNVGSVVAPGGSVAHELHEAGIPLVLASQFPLSARGSVIMADVVYTRLLRGEDPRTLVHDLRQALHVGCPSAHDWASVVVYAALPPDMDAQVAEARFRRAVDALEAAIERHEQAGDRRPDETIRAMRAAMAWVDATVPEDDSRPRAFGVIANAKKRVAQMLYPGPLALRSGAAADAAPPSSPGTLAFQAAAAPPSPKEAAGADARAEARRTLDEARRAYRDIFRAGEGAAWPLVQALTLAAALDPPSADPAPGETRPTFADQWTSAFAIADDNLRTADFQRVTWARSSLVELFVLAQLLPADHWAHGVARARASEHLDHVLAVASTFDAYSLRRQLLRFSTWWWQDRPDLGKLPADLARTMEDRGVARTHRERR